MEVTGDNSSDRDKKMMGVFEGLSEEDKKKAEKKEKDDQKRKPPKLPLFEVVAGEQKPDQKKDLLDILNDSTEEDIKPENIEQLDEEETEHIVNRYIEARTEEISEERDAISDVDIEATAAADANIALLENLREANENGGVDNEEQLDNILESTIAELDLTPPETADDEVAAANIPPSAAGGAPPTPRPPLPLVVGGAIPFPPFGGEPAFPDAPAAPTERTVYVENRKKQAANLLVGGALGYLIGRRRGRIKTERRLMPIQEKLEKEVKDLHSKIADREEKIRIIAAEKVRTTPEVKPDTAVNKLEKQNVKEPEVFEKPEIPVVARIEKLVRTIIPPIERATEKVAANEKRVEKLPLPELLAVAKRMEFQGTTVDRLYENNRIDSIGLRRAVEEFLAGRRFEAALIENLHRYDSPEHLQTHTTLSSAAGTVGAGGTYGIAANSSQEDQTQAGVSPSAYGASGFGDVSRTQPKRSALPPAYILGSVILGLIIAAILIL